MRTKISSALDSIADSLEEKGLVKEALEVDKVADAIEANLGEKKTRLRVVGPHTFVDADDPSREYDSDDVQWHCPKCKSRWNDAAYPCIGCGHKSPYEIVK